MKFSTLLEKQSFLVEIGQYDLVFKIKEDFEPTPEMISEFIKRRTSLITPLRDFRKSQTQKSNWVKNKASYMSGIKKFHKSTAGKRMHRNLGRFLATRLTKPKLINQPKESLDTSFSLMEISEILKTISSYKTHLYIELDYFRPAVEQLVLEEMIFDFVPMLSSINEKILSYKELSDDDYKFLTELCPRDDIEISIKELVPGITEEAILELLPIGE